MDLGMDLADLGVDLVDVVDLGVDLLDLLDVSGFSEFGIDFVRKGIVRKGGSAYGPQGYKMRSPAKGPDL